MLSIDILPVVAQTGPAASACASIRFELANPRAGAIVPPGAYVVQGIAMDSRAKQGLGIDKIDFFLDSREAGGVNLGTVVPGALPGPYGPISFQATTSVPNKVGAHDFFAYAHSSVNGAESVISVPVSVGQDPSKSLQTAAAATASCKLGNPPSATTATTPAATSAAQASTTTTSNVAPTASTITLSIGNPSPNNTIKAGAYSLQGSASDTAARAGSGIDRVDIFLGNRDGGGMFLGAAVPGTTGFWQAIVNLPTNQTGLHELWFHAHSSVSGQSMGVGVPVTIIR